MAARAALGRTLLAVFFIYAGYRQLLAPGEPDAAAETGLRAALVGPLAVLYVVGGYLLVGCAVPALAAAGLALALLTSTALEAAAGQAVDEAQLMTALALVGALLSVGHSLPQEDWPPATPPRATEGVVAAGPPTTPPRGLPPSLDEVGSEAEGTPGHPSPCAPPPGLRCGAADGASSSASSPAVARRRSPSPESCASCSSSAVRLREMQLAALTRLLRSAEAELQQQREAAAAAAAAAAAPRPEGREVALLRLQNQGLKRLLAQCAEPETVPQASSTQSSPSTKELTCQELRAERQLIFEYS
eukprot:EG_transcript_14524